MTRESLVYAKGARIFGRPIKFFRVVSTGQRARRMAWSQKRFILKSIADERRWIEANRPQIDAFLEKIITYHATKH